HETRECIARHRTRHDRPAPGEFDPARQPPLEGQVVDAADEIAYDNHDLEDGIRAGIIRQEQLDGLELWREAAGRAEQAFAGLDAGAKPTQIITFLIHILTIDLLEHSSEQVRRAGVETADQARDLDHRLIGFSPAMQPRKRQLEDFLFENVYHHYRVMRMATKAKRFLIELFQAYVEGPEQLDPSAQARIGEETAAGRSPEDALYRVVCDYIAGMTDRFAQDEYRRLFVPFERV
ncbi:MAG: deoxyguanosinetriphosphate triphosphohydrolase, partial [bacterium]